MVKQGTQVWLAPKLVHCQWTADFAMTHRGNNHWQNPEWMVFNITVAGASIHCEGAGIDDTGKAARLQTMNRGEAGTNNQDQHI